ncbi:MAG TPA: L,D-transpeptidase [Thermoanaerobaculia bacterium]|nr:L,D-transpeptidase [Thermoanaerobaculia bacterium]
MFAVGLLQRTWARFDLAGLRRASAAFVLLAVARALAGQEPPPEAPPIRERLYRLEPGPIGESELRRRFEPAQLAVLEKLNRAGVSHLPRLETLVVPGEWLEDELRYSPFPPSSAWAAGHPKALVVDQPAQAFGAYAAGRLVRWGPVSSGRRQHPTPSGLFHLNWRSRGRHSTVDPDWYMPWYFNFDNDRGLALHQFTLPGRPASHACVRLLERDAVWLYEWGEGWTLDARGWNVLDPGTPLWIAGRYDFDAPPPWRSLEWLARGVELPEPGPEAPP